ncbi:uncharacterized protein [Pyxicephalus adspersus]|uniref:uncharacterized protein isoform X2 n=1 Tax=Pyxicephalus adspersus TaxID=30357 RepID=UPI003B59C663
MENDRRRKIRRILKITLEIIYLLTGEDYTIVKKVSGTSGIPNHSQRPSRSPIMESTSSSSTPQQHNDKRILQLIYKMMELLTGEVPIRCQDVTVYFSMEEWEYLEGHKDLYKDVMMEDHQTSPDGSSNGNPPERCPRPLYSQSPRHEGHSIPHHHRIGGVKGSINQTERYHRPSYYQDSTRERHNIPYYDRIVGVEGSRNQTERSPRLLYFRDSTRQCHTIPHLHRLGGVVGPMGPLGRCPRLLDFWDSTQDHHSISHHYRVGGVVGTINPPERSPRPLYSRCPRHKGHSIPHHHRIGGVEGPINPPERCPRPLFFRDSKQECRTIPHHHRLGRVVGPINPTEICSDRLHPQDFTGEDQEIPHHYQVHGAKGPINPPERCLRLLHSQNSTEKHHSILQEKVINQKTPGRTYYACTKKSTEGPTTETTENGNPPERCPRPLYSQDSTQKDQEIPHRHQVQNHINTPTTKKTKDNDDGNKTHETPAVEAPEQNGNSKAEENPGLVTSQHPETDPAVDNATTVCGRDELLVKDTDGLSNSKTRKEKNIKDSSAFGHSSINVNLTKTYADDSNPTEAQDFTAKQVEATTAEQAEPKASTAEKTEANAITSKQTTADASTSEQAEAKDITSKQTEADATNAEQAEATTAEQTETTTAEQTETTTAEQAEATTQEQTETTTAEQAESNAITLKPTKADATTAEIIEADATTAEQALTTTAEQTKTNAITSKQTEADVIHSNLTDSSTITLYPNKTDHVPLNQTSSDSAVGNPTTVCCRKTTAKQAEVTTAKQAEVTTEEPAEVTTAEQAEVTTQEQTETTTAEEAESNAITLKPTKANATTAEQAEDPTAEQALTTTAEQTEANAITSKQSGADVIHSNLTDSSTITLYPIKADPVPLNQTSSDSAVGNLTTVCSNDPFSVTLKNTIHMSSLKAPGIVIVRNTNVVTGQEVITSNQTEANMVLNLTNACRDNTSFPSPLQDVNNISNSKANNTINNAIPVIVYKGTMPKRTEVNYAVDVSTTICSDNAPSAPVKDTNNISNIEEMENKKTGDSKTLAGHSVITFNQTEPTSDVDNTSGAFMNDAHHALFKATSIVYKSKGTKISTTENSTTVVCVQATASNLLEALNSPTTIYGDDTLPAPLKDTDDASHSEVIKTKKIRNSRSLVGQSAITSNQTKADSPVESLTTTCRQDSLIASLGDTYNKSDYKETKMNRIRKSKCVVKTSSQTKSDSLVDNPATTCRQDSHIDPLQDSSNESNHEETKNIRTRKSKSVVDHRVITSNQTEADSALNKPQAACRDNTSSVLKDTNNVTDSDTVKMKNNRHSSTDADHEVIMTNHTKVNSAVDHPMEACRDITLTASKKDSNNVLDSDKTKRNTHGSATTEADYEVIMTNHTEIKSAVDHPRAACSYNTLPSSKRTPDNVCDPGKPKRKNKRHSKTEADHGVITSFHTKVNSAVDHPTGVCRDNSPPASTKDANNASTSKATKKRKRKVSKSVVGHNPITSKQTEGDLAINKPTTTCRDDSFLPPSKHSKFISNVGATKRRTTKNSSAVVAIGTVTANNTNGDSNETTSACNGTAPTAPLQDTNDVSNLVGKNVKKKANDGPVVVDCSLEKPSGDSNNETDRNPSSSDTPKMKKKRKREKNHVCSECGKRFLFNAHLVVHFRSHTGERPFPCHECGKSFPSTTRLSAHQKFHSKEKPYSCSECNKSFYNNTHLKTHLKIHQNERPYSCNECGKSFIHASNFTKHQEIHTGVKRFLCSFCGKRFRQSSHLRSHQKQHTGDQQFSCTKCRKKFPTEGALISHHKFHRIKLLSCPECGKHYINRVSFDRHRRVHTGHKLLSCSECGKCFINKTHLSIHQRIHTGEKPFACSICSWRFSDKSAFTRHTKTHKPKTPIEPPPHAKSLHKQKTLLTNAGPATDAKQFACPECKKCFNTQAKLTKHQESHSKENPYPCDNCGQRFSSETLLTAHQCHLGEKSFFCLKCDMNFKTQLELEAHQKNHEEKEFVCSDCGHRFTKETLLTTHQKRHHGKKLFFCAECNKNFKTQLELKTHQKNHPDLKSFSCTDCGQHFSSEALLMAHQKRHPGKKRLSRSKNAKDLKVGKQQLEVLQPTQSDKKSFLCNDCGRGFTRQTLLDAHQKQHRFPCSICKKGFKTQLELKTHQKNHLKEKPFMCSDCGRRFATEALLAAHRERHVSKKRYSCVECGRGFNERSNFEMHCRIHTGERPFSCSECSKTFAVKSNMIRHYKLHTGEKPYT